MDDSNNAAPPAAPGPSTLSGPTRAWSADDMVVVAFALLGFGGGVLLPLKFNIPPITTSFLLATGIAALAYRFLGGMQGASMAVGTLKLGGALAALVGIAMFINSTLVSQVRLPPPPYQVWVVSGQVTDDAGKPIEPFGPNDIGLSPPLLVPYPLGKFQLNVYSWPDVDGKMAFPVLSVNHDGFDPHAVDLNPSATNDVKITRTGQTIQIQQIVLHRTAAAQYQPAQQPLKPVSYEAETTAVTPEVKP